MAMQAYEMSEKQKPGGKPGQPAPHEALKPHRPLTEALARLYRDGDAGAPDAAPGGLAEFGHARSNPVPAASLEEMQRYLERLRLHGGQRVAWKLAGTIAAGVNGKPVFEYAILSLQGQTLTTLYLSLGYDGTSSRPPRGFVLAPDANARG
jgi:hypothetical protein